jgi:teichuronic acid biosynthesis glycosyltransferase TuaH
MVAEELRRYCHVLWVDPPISMATSERQRYGASRLPVPRLRTPMPGLTRLTTYALPLHTRRAIRTTTAPLVLAQIRWALGRLGGRPHAVIDGALSNSLRGWAPEVLKVFYGTDDYVAGAALMGLDVAALEQAERSAVSEADLVIAVSPALAERWRAMGARRVEMVPNGVRPEAYDGARGATAGRGLPHPVAGVVGHLSDRIDVDILTRLVEAGCSLLLVGARDPRWEPDRVAALLAREQVAWVDRQPHEALPALLRQMDVGITPYRDDSFNRASFPLKMLEYLAVGLPSVTTDLPAARWLDTDLVRRVADPADFTSAVLAEVATARSPELVAARREFAREHTWASRAALIAAHLGLRREVSAER